MDLSVILDSLPADCRFLKEDDRFLYFVEKEKDFGVYVDGVFFPASAEQILSLAAKQLLQTIQCSQCRDDLLPGMEWDDSPQYNDCILCALNELSGQNARQD